MSTAKWTSWAELVRIPTMFTIIADVSAAFFLVLGGSGWYTGALQSAASTDDESDLWIVLGLTLVSAVSLYWAGMILNDVFDLRRDVRARRGRPLARRAITVRSARSAGWGLLLIGVVPPIAVGFCCDTHLGWVPTIVAILLGGCVVLYDGPLKRTPLAPLVMGACRGGSFLLGATSATAALTNLVDEASLASLQRAALGSPLKYGFTPVVLAFALGMATYIAGLTTFGRREAVGDRTIHLPVGLAMMAMGSLMLAFAPRAAAGTIADDADAWTVAWRLDPVVVFPAAILLMLTTALFRGSTTALHPSPQRVGATIGSGLTAIIPIAATITMLAVGANIAIAIFALLIPSRLLAARFRMT